MVSGQGLNPGPDDFGDFVQPFQIEDLELQGRLVRLGPGLATILAPHAYPAPVATVLAESIALAAVLSSVLKYDGIFTLQTQSDGPVNLMVADVTSAGALRAYARFDDDRLELTGESTGAQVPRLLGAGHMAFTVDQGPDTDRYQGITEICGATLADCAHTYFRQSEQLETAIILTAETGGGARGDARGDAGGKGPGARAAALMIQRLPPRTENDWVASEDREDDWRRAVALMGSISSDELLDASLAPSSLLYRLYHEDGVRLFDQHPLFAACRCSRDKVMGALRSFPADEIAAMAENGVITTTCEFCKAEYVFDAGSW